MKKIAFLILIAVISSCQSPSSPSSTQGQSNQTGNQTNGQIYIPPVISGTKETNVLRAPNGMSRSIMARGAIAQSDPLLASCNVPGSVYMFYDDNALVQYIPIDGTYTMFSLACKGDVEAHNALNPGALWDIVTVSLPGPVFDLSHDPDPIVLRIRFLNNDGTDHLFNGVEVNMVASDPAEYATWVNADGSPNDNTRQTFDAWGATDGNSVIHMQLGGDGINIPSATFHY